MHNIDLKEVQVPQKLSRCNVIIPKSRYLITKHPGLGTAIPSYNLNQRVSRVTDSTRDQAEP